jgi:hypothetical protein
MAEDTRVFYGAGSKKLEYRDYSLYINFYKHGDCRKLWAEFVNSTQAYFS